MCTFCCNCRAPYEVLGEPTAVFDCDELVNDVSDNNEDARVREVAGVVFFFFLGGTPPFRPLPLGMPVRARLVKFGRFFALTNHSKKAGRSHWTSAAATLWEQIPRLLLLPQSLSQLYCPLALAITRCGLFPDELFTIKPLS